MVDGLGALAAFDTRGDLARGAGGMLLPGEDPASMLVDDAAHWCRLYWELLSSKALLLSQVRETMAVASAHMRGNVRLDSALVEYEVLLRGQISHCRDRLGYWQHRRLVLAGPTPSQP